MWINSKALFCLLCVALTAHPALLYAEDLASARAFESKRCEELIVGYSPDVSQDPENSSRLELSCVIINTTFRQLNAFLGARAKQELRVYVLSDESFRQVKDVPNWSQSVFIDGRIVLSEELLVRDDLERVLKHEAVHAYFYLSGLNIMPEWMEEGLAEFFSDPNTTAVRDANVRAMLKDPHMHFNDLPEGEVEAAYASSRRAIELLLREHSFSTLREYFNELQETGNARSSFRSVFGKSESYYLKRVF